MTRRPKTPEEPEIPPPEGDEEEGRRVGRRLSRSKKLDADTFVREGYDVDQMPSHQRRKDRFLGRQKVWVEALPNVEGAACPGIVVSVSRRSCEVEFDDPAAAGLAAEDEGVVPAYYSPRLEKGSESLVAVGDRVEAHRTPGTGWLVTRVEPRRSRLARPGPDARDHLDMVIAANIDKLVIVVSCERPKFHPRFVDRFLVVAQMGGVTPEIFLNKTDLLAAGDPGPDLGCYERLGVPIIRGSVETGEGIEELARSLSGQLSAVAGHSGVGKTSVLNALVPGLFEQVGDVRSKDGRGRHTTTRARLFRLPSGGSLIDTPGIRELALSRLEAGDLHLYFTDFDAWFGKCRFNDCRHVSEPGCAVRDAAERGDIHPDRYGSYLRILETL